MRRTWILLSLLLVAGGGKTKRLSEAEQAHFYALKPYMDDAEEKAFLKIKSEVDRDAWLKAHGLWERFYKYDAHAREQIVAGEVAKGWHEDQVIMAWGAPWQRRKITGRPAERSELYVYRFEIDKHGIVRVWQPKSRTAYHMVDRYQIEVNIDDDVVTEMLRKEDWE